MTSAVVNVPMIPSEAMGTIARRKRRQPMSMPPSKRMTISATTPIRSTVWMCGKGDGRRESREQEEGRRGNREVRREPVHEQGEQDAGRDDENDRAEIEQLVHAFDANGFLTTPSFRT